MPACSVASTRGTADKAAAVRLCPTNTAATSANLCSAYANGKNGYASSENCGNLFLPRYRTPAFTHGSEGGAGTMTIFSVRAFLIDGGVIDLLQFVEERDAAEHRDYVMSCRVLGYERVEVVSRLVIEALSTMHPLKASSGIEDDRQHVDRIQRTQEAAAQAIDQRSHQQSGKTHSVRRVARSCPTRRGTRAA